MEDWHENIKVVSVKTRLLAFLWDYVIILCYLFLLCIISFFTRPWLIPLFTSNPLQAEFTGFVLITLPVYLYFSICEGTRWHATCGKHRMGIVVVNIQNQPMGLRQSIFRSILKFIPWELAHFTIWHMLIPSKYPDYLIYLLLAAVYVLAFIYLLSPLKFKYKQTLYDFIAGTVVRYKEDTDYL